MNFYKNGRNLTNNERATNNATKIQRVLMITLEKIRELGVVEEIKVQIVVGLDGKRFANWVLLRRNQRSFDLRVPGTGTVHHRRKELGELSKKPDY